MRLRTLLGIVSANEFNVCVFRKKIHRRAQTKVINDQRVPVNCDLRRSLRYGFDGAINSLFSSP